MTAAAANFDYKIKISAFSKNSADVDNYFGAAKGASNASDIYDAEEPPQTLEDKYTSLYFPHNDWQRNAGRYANDIRAIADCRLPIADCENPKSEIEN